MTTADSGMKVTLTEVRRLADADEKRPSELKRGPRELADFVHRGPEDTEALMVDQTTRSSVPVTSTSAGQPRPAPPADPRLIRALFSRWEPERQELLIRLRPRHQEIARADQ